MITEERGGEGPNAHAFVKNKEGEGGRDLLSEREISP